EFIHSSGKVKINSMDSTRENYLSEYVPRFVRAVRIKGQLGGNRIQRITDNDFYQEILTKPE
ncbi:MAG: hypothetical protein KAT15_18880, partial [Bacteroidales bacterium]|nr:hypothetical protein [Bacteroidales bacterium]